MNRLKRFKRIKELQQLIKRDQDLISKRYEILKKKMHKLEQLKAKNKRGRKTKG